MLNEAAIDYRARAADVLCALLCSTAAVVFAQPAQEGAPDPSAPPPQAPASASASSIDLSAEAGSIPAPAAEPPAPAPEQEAAATVLALYRSGRVDQASAAAEQGFGQYPESIRLTVLSSMLLSAEAHHAQAVARLEHALQSHPDDSYLWLGLSQAATAGASFAKARNAALRARSLDGRGAGQPYAEDPLYHLWLGHAGWRTGARPAAMARAYRTAVELDPTLSEASSRLATLEARDTPNAAVDELPQEAGSPNAEHHYRGMLLRASVGGLYQSLDVALPQPMQGIASVGFSGLGLSLSSDIGGFMVENVALYVRLGLSSLNNPTATVGNREATTDGVSILTVSGGPGVVVYAVPSHLYFAAAVGIAGMTMTLTGDAANLQADSDVGVWVSADIGIEGFIGGASTLGLALQTTYANLPGGDGSKLETWGAGLSVSLGMVAGG